MRQETCLRAEVKVAHLWPAIPLLTKKKGGDGTSRSVLAWSSWLTCVSVHAHRLCPRRSAASYQVSHGQLASERRAGPVAAWGDFWLSSLKMPDTTKAATPTRICCMTPVFGMARRTRHCVTRLDASPCANDIMMCSSALETAESTRTWRA